MSGHSKWSQIKRKKGAKDLIKGNVFTKLSRIITLAVIEGGRITDSENNIKLRLAIEKAKQSNMPKDNIKRAIEKGVGQNQLELKEVVYEGFGPYGMALIILAATDNSNRTSAEIRNILAKFDGKLANPGAVSYFFKKCGQIVLDKNKVSENYIFDFAKKIDAFDFEETEDSYIIYFPFENLGKVNETLGETQTSPPEIIYKPTSFVNLANDQEKNKILDLIDEIENLDDVQGVFINADI